MQKRTTYALFALATLLLPQRASAHSDAANSGLAAGMVHPVTGPDHLLAMLSVGIVSALMGGKSIWLVPLAFVSAMLVGALCGMNGWVFPYAEKMIALSLVILGLAVAFVQRGFRVWLAFAIVFCFGLFHGNAHGAEMPAQSLPWLFATGFLVATVFIHIAGIFVGELIAGSQYARRLSQVCGAGMMLAGGSFLISNFIKN